MPQETTFRLAVEGAADRPKVRLAGDLDLATVARVRSVVGALLRRRPTRVTIDLGDLDIVETVAVATLLRLRDDAAAGGVDVVLSNPSRVVRQLIALAGRPH